MTTALPLFVIATQDNFDEYAYFLANPDVKRACDSGGFKGLAYNHFVKYGKKEGRKLRVNNDKLLARSRKQKIERLEPFLRKDMPHQRRGIKYDFLTAELRKVAGISATENVSSHAYSGEILEIIESCSDGLILDCGAGLQATYYENIVNYEIEDFISTDVIGIGEELPFKDNTFDAVISVAVFEHLRDPFRSAKEIHRVLKPNGVLVFCASFMQPYHGFPHHYFNMTPAGARALFEDFMEIEKQTVPIYLNPVRSLAWFLRVWASGLNEDLKDKFLNAKIKDFMIPNQELHQLEFATALDSDKAFEIAAGTLVVARKVVKKEPSTIS